MSTDKLVNCSRIGVDCVANDPVDVKAGGPVFLGFDFNVREEETEEMKKFISDTLIEEEIPVVNISTKAVSVLEKDVWTKERISKSIKADADYLKGEASRNYTPYIR